MYEKINWEADTLLTPARFNHMETQYDEVIAYWQTNSFRVLDDEELVVEVLVAEPSQAEGRIYFNSVDEKLYVSDGSSYIDISEFAEDV